MINIFLDSNILYTDPLMQRGKNKVLFEKINRLGGKIFICDIVYKEVLNNYKKQLKEINLEIDKIKNKLDKLDYKTITLLNINIELELKKIERKFKEYIKEEKIIILQTSNDILPEVIERSIKRKKPFSEKKQEFRDCIIWLTYAHKVENEKLDNCVLITQNTSDFCDKKGNLHRDLLDDTKKFKFHKDAYNFLKHESELISKMELNEMSQKFVDYKIDEDKFKMREIFDELYSNINNYFIELSEDEVSNLYGGMYLSYIEMYGMDIRSITKISNDINIQNSTITEFGDIEIEASVELKVYDSEEDWNIASTSILLKGSYWAHLRIKQNFQVDDKIYKIELDNIKVKKIDENIINDYYNDLELTAHEEMMEAQEEYYRH